MKNHLSSSIHSSIHLVTRIAKTISGQTHPNIFLSTLNFWYQHVKKSTVSLLCSRHIFHLKSCNLIGHQTYIRAKLLVWLSPRCPSCNIDSTLCRIFDGTTTRDPHIKQPLCRLSSPSLFRYCTSSGGSSSPVGHPSRAYRIAALSTGSLAENRRIFSAVTGDESKNCIKCTVSAGTGSSANPADTGKRDSPSQLPCFEPGTYVILYLKPESSIAHLVTRGEAIGDNGLFSPSIPNSGLWSVLIVNSLPAR